MKKRTLLPFLFFFLYLLLTPETAVNAAREGLLLWYHSVLPALFPFMVLCTLALRLGLLDHLMLRLYRPFHLMTGCSPYGAFAIMAGFLCGFPMGAKITHDLQLQEKISPEEADWLMGFVNNLSPGFLISYLACDQMKLPDWAGCFLLNILGSAFLYGLITASVFRKKQRRTTWNPPQSSAVQAGGLFPIIDECISDTIQNILRLGAYITMFAILGSALALLLPEGGIGALLLRSSVEVTNGIRLLSVSSVPLHIRFVLVNALCAFGGLSALAQSAGIAAMDKSTLLSYIKSRVYITLLCVLLSCSSVLFSVFL